MKLHEKNTAPQTLNWVAFSLMMLAFFLLAVDFSGHRELAIKIMVFVASYVCGLVLINKM